MLHPADQVEAAGEVAVRPVDLREHPLVACAKELPPPSSAGNSGRGRGCCCPRRSRRDASLRGQAGWSRVLGRAVRRPTMAVGMAASWMNRIWRSKMSSLSPSKPTMKPPDTSMPFAWMAWTLVSMSRPEVLALAGRLERGAVGRLDAHEHHVEARLDHLVHQGLVLGQIEAGLGEQGEGVVPLLLPAGQFGEQAPDLAPVADEVVVHHEEGAPPAPLVQQIHLRQELGRVSWCGAGGRRARRCRRIRSGGGTRGSIGGPSRRSACVTRSNRGGGVRARSGWGGPGSRGFGAPR